MNNDAIEPVPSQPLATEVLQNNLINALNRFQSTAFEKEFLTTDLSLDEHARQEAFFGFGIGEYQFMVKASCFCEVFVDTAIAAVPNAPHCLFGLSNIRGVLIPVYQIYSSLNLQLPKKHFIFVVGKGESAIGLMVDALPVSLSFSAFQREATHKHINPVLQKIVSSGYKANESKIIEPKTSVSKASESKFSESKFSESKFSESKFSESRASESKTSEYKESSNHWMLLDGDELGSQLLAMANSSHNKHSHMSKTALVKAQESVVV